MPSLSDKLKALGVKIGAADLPPPTPKDSLPALAGLEGDWQRLPAGLVWVQKRVFPAEYWHGTLPIFPLPPLQGLALWAGDPRIADLQPSQLAFLDTETSGLAGGTGTYAFMVGAGRFVAQEFHLSIFFLRDPAEEAALLQALAAFLAPCAALVTFNGKAFDAPLLRTRYTLHGMPAPFKDFAHIDLLPLARRLWRDRLPNRALKYLEEHIMSAPRSSEEVPGYEIPWLYFDFLRTGDPTLLQGVFYHNAMDVVAMTALLRLTADWLHAPLQSDIQHGQDVIALAKLQEDLHQWDVAAQLYERGLQTNLPEADFWQAIKRLSTLQKRRGDLQTALRLWQQAAENNHPFALLELAKHAEHRQKDYPAALAYAQKAQALLAADSSLPSYARQHWQTELQKRISRLLQKQQNARSPR